MTLNDKDLTDASDQNHSIKISGINLRTRKARDGALISNHDDLFGG